MLQTKSKDAEAAPARMEALPTVRLFSVVVLNVDDNADAGPHIDEERGCA